MKKPRKNAHGGRREGAGRPKKERKAGRADLITAIREATTAKALGAIARELAADLLEGNVDRLLAESAISALREARQSLKAAREEKLEARIRALEILTPEEERLLADHRKKVAGPPAAPGVYVPPPGTNRDDSQRSSAPGESTPDQNRDDSQQEPPDPAGIGVT